jgi:hypothetical protein
MDPDILAYYERGEEAGRLTAAPHNLLELLRTQAILRAALPAPPARVLDVGGAAGVHARRLAGDGYEVRLIDPVPLHVEHALATGVHRNPDRVPSWFTTAYFHRPKDLRAEVEDAGFADVRLIGVEGPAWLLGDLGGWLDDGERRALLLERLARLEDEPALIGASAHLLALARSPA